MVVALRDAGELLRCRNGAPARGPGMAGQRLSGVHDAEAAMEPRPEGRGWQGTGQRRFGVVAAMEPRPEGRGWPAHPRAS